MSRRNGARRCLACTVVIGGVVPEPRSDMAKRVLIVEDDALLALDIAHQMSDAGFEVVGPATSVAKALRLVAEVGCDAAILDVNLGRETGAPVALELKARGTPFVVLSGYSREQHPDAFQGAPFLSKPARPDVLVAALRKSVGDI
jgi:DNA-binding response OmpR family regulator